jgi:hypothetical protein
MPIAIEKRPDDAAIIFVALPPIILPDDQIAQLNEVVLFKQEMGRHVYRILDLRGILMDFDDLLSGMEYERGVPGGANDPDVTTYFIGTTALVQFGVKTLQDYPHLYGKTDVHLVASLEEAIAEVQVRLAQR